MRTKIAVLVLSLGLFCGSVPAFADGWLEVRSDHFTVLTDSNEKQARHILDQFERMRWVFQTLFPKSKVDPVSPIVVLAARNGKSFQSLEPQAYLAAGQLKLGGYFLRTQDKNYVLLRLDAEQEQHPYAAIYHEYTHLQTSGDSAWLPLWLNEGLAEFVQNTEIRDKEVLLGEASSDDILYLRQNQIIPLPVLFQVDAKSPYYHEEQKGSVFYAESWALTHFLFITDKENKTNRVGDYETLLRQHVDSLTAAEKAFGNLKQLQNALEYYIRGGNYKEFILSSAAAPLDESKYKVRILTGPESDAARADVLACVGRETEAHALLDSVLKSDPKNVLAHETLGFLALRDGNRDEARKFFGDAVEFGSQSYLAYYYFAALSAEQGGPEKGRETEPELRKAIELNPRFAPAYEQIASTLWAMQRYADAETVLRDLIKNAANSHDAAVAQSRIAQLEEMQAYETNAKAQRLPDSSHAGVAALAAPDLKPKHPNEAADGPRHEVIGVIRDVQCSYPSAIDFKVEGGGKIVSIYHNNYYKLEFSTLGFMPQGDLNPCTAIEGMKARVQYAQSSDKTVDGQAISVELRK